MESTGRIIGFDESLISNFFIQGISVVSLVLWLVMAILFVRLLLLGIKALKIYIKNNS